MMTLPVDESPVVHFCALEYRAHELSGPSALEHVIILFLRNPSGALRVLAHRDWRKIVQPRDHEYVRALLEDFIERATSAPDALFKQAASLSVGPLVTYAVGTGVDLKASMNLFEICKNMADLSRNESADLSRNDPLN